MGVNRRELLYGMAAACAGFAIPRLPMRQEKRVLLRTDATRLRRRLEELSVYGRPDGGTFADGVSRVAYSDADVAGRKYAMQAMVEAGLEPRIDPAETFLERAPERTHPCRAFCLGRTLIPFQTGVTLAETSGRCPRSK